MNKENKKMVRISEEYIDMIKNIINNSEYDIKFISDFVEEAIKEKITNINSNKITLKKRHDYYNIPKDKLIEEQIYIIDTATTNIMNIQRF